MGRRWRSLLGVTLGLGLAAAPLPAGALEPSKADIERARELYENGVSLYDEGSYEGAALAFEKAYELSDDNNLLFNIALAYDRMGEFETAIEYLDRYRALAPKSERADLERRKKSLVKRLEKQRENEANGDVTAEDETFEADEGLENEDLGLEDDEPTEAPPKPERWVPPVAWALTGTAVVGLGLGVGFGVSSLQRNKAGEQGCTSADSDLFCLSSSGTDLRRGRTHAIVADVSFAVGAAAAVGAVIVVAIAAKRRKSPDADRPETDVALVPTRGGAGLALTRRF